VVVTQCVQHDVLTTRQHRDVEHEITELCMHGLWQFRNLVGHLLESELRRDRIEVRDV
jgi:hypothetical protein